MKIELTDNWGAVTPRAWQAAALPKLVRHFSQPEAKPGVVQACPRSGKSKLMAQFAACCQLEPSECIVVSSSTMFLVEQLEATFRERFETEGFMVGPSRIGTYYTHGKDVLTPIIITCTPSVPELAEALLKSGRRCAFWIADEVHRTAGKAIQAAAMILNPKHSLGFSATPYLADENKTLKLFEVVIEKYLAKQALKDGVVVPWRLVPWTGGSVTLDQACMELTDLATGPGMFNSMSINDAEVFVKKLDAHCPEKSMTIHSGMPKAERKKRLELLRTGKLHALVHVNMLQEGVDLPWLRWLCLRRPVRSRVRFVQEVCRAMSSDEGKTECVIYDPHGLIEDFKLTYEAALGGEFEDDDETEEEKALKESEKAEKRMQQMVFELMRELVEVKAGKKPLSTTPLHGYLKELIWAFEVSGLIDRNVTSTFWRKSPATEKQLSALQRMKWAATVRCVPKIHKAALTELTSQAPALNRGVNSDFMDILISLGNARKWPDMKVLDMSAENAMKIVEENKKHFIKPPTSPETPQPVYRSKVKKPAVRPPSLFDGT